MSRLETGIHEELKQHAIGSGVAHNGNGKTEPERKPLFELMASVTEEEIDCLWPARIPRGKLSIFDGDAGVGKSTVALAIAAAMSRRDVTRHCPTVRQRT